MNNYFYREEAGINLYITLFDDKIFIDQDTINSILRMLNNIYLNYLLLLFLISCTGGMTCLYICSNNNKNKKNKEYALINTIEPTMVKGEIISKVYV